jgi:hypothetical protein
MPHTGKQIGVVFLFVSYGERGNVLPNGLFGR